MADAPAAAGPIIGNGNGNGDKVVTTAQVPIFDHTTKTLAARAFVVRYESHGAARQWTAEQFYSEFSNSMSGEPWEWATIVAIKFCRSSPTWETLKAEFIKTYATAVTVAASIRALAELRQRAGESTIPFYVRVASAVEKFPDPVLSDQALTHPTAADVAKVAGQMTGSEAHIAIAKFYSALAWKKACDHGKDITVRRQMSYGLRTNLREFAWESKEVDNHAWMHELAEHERTKAAGNGTTSTSADHKATNGVNGTNKKKFGKKGRINAMDEDISEDEEISAASIPKTKGKGIKKSGKKCAWCNKLNHTEAECRDKANAKKAAISKSAEYKRRPTTKATSAVQGASDDEDDRVESVSAVYDGLQSRVETALDRYNSPAQTFDVRIPGLAYYKKTKATKNERYALLDPLTVSH